MVEMLLPRQVRDGGAEGFEGATGGLQVGTLGQLAGEGRQGASGGRGMARQIGRQGLIQGRQGLPVAGQVIGGQGAGGIGGGEDQGAQQGIGLLVVGRQAGVHPDRRGIAGLIGGGDRQGGMGELGLGVEDEGGLGHHPLTLVDTAQDLDLGVPHPAEPYLPCPVAQAAFIDVDDRLAAMLEDGGARRQQGRGGGELDSRLGGLAMAQPAVGVLQDDPHPRRAGHFVQAGIDEGDRRGQDLPWQGGYRHLHGLALLKPGQVRFVGVEDEPHAREIADLEQGIVGLDILTFVHRAGDDRTGQGGTDADHGRGLEGVLQDADLLLGQAQLQETLAGGGALGLGGGHRAGLDTLDVLALSGEHLGAEHGGQGGAGLDLGADVIDLELLNPARHPGGQDPMAGVVILDDAADPQGANHGATGHRAGRHAGDGRLGGVEPHQVGIVG